MKNNLIHKVLKVMEKNNWIDLPLIEGYYGSDEVTKVFYNLGIYIFKTRKSIQDSKPREYVEMGF